MSRPIRHRREVGVSGTAVGCRGAVPASWGGRGGRSAGGVTTAQPRACSGAQQGRAADCLQPPLLRRCGFRQQLTPSVGLLGAALLPRVARGKSRPCPTAGTPPAGRCAATRADRESRTRWRVRCRPQHAGGAVVVASAPAAAWLVACAGPRWCRRARVWPVSRPRPPGDGRRVEGRRLPLRRGRVGGSSPAWGRASGAGCRGRGRQPHRVPSSTRPATGGSARPAGRAGHGDATRPPPLSLAPRQPPSLTTHRVWRHPTARMVPAWVAAVGHREARVPASGASNPTKACRRRLPASARASLPLSAAPDARRWVAGRSMVVWRGPGKKQTMAARPRPDVRRGPR